MFPTPRATNFGFYVVGVGSDKPFSTLMVDVMPDLALWGSSNGQFFPRWTYLLADDSGTLDFTTGADVDEWGYRRVDNVTDEILASFGEFVGDEVTKDDIFYYAYGILHDPDYRARYAADLKKMLPHIPTPESADQFATVADIGRQLADLHLNYEAGQPYPLNVQLMPGADPNNRETWRVEKMRWRTKADRDAIVYNGKITITGIPATAHDYLLGSRTALEWIIERYQVKSDPSSGIVNDPNEWCDEHDDPTDIVDLIKKVTTVSVETVALVEQLGADKKTTLSASV
jgi:predicted helicase